MAPLSAPMPKLMTMLETSQAQDEITLLERQLNELEAEMSRFTVGKTGQETPLLKRDVKPKQLLSDIPKGKQFGKGEQTPTAKGFSDGHLKWYPNKPGDRDTKDHMKIQPSQLPMPFSSTPKAETGASQSQGLMSEQNKTDDMGSKKSLNMKIKPATFDGSGNWLDYRALFEVCAELNGWTEKERGMYLAVSLRGQAQGVFGNLAGGTHNYTELIKALEERFAPPNQTELYRIQLRERRQKASESLFELGQDIRRLTNLAYPTAPSDLRETLAKEQFIDALVSSDMRLRIKQARPANLNDAVRHAVELEAFNRAERRHLEGQGYMRVTSEKPSDENSDFQNKMETLQKTVTDLQKSFNAWKGYEPRSENKSRTNSNRQHRYHKPRCYVCGSEDNLKLKCPSLKNNGKLKESKGDETQQNKQVASVNGGLYADCKINGIDTECLIDTGATLSVLSLKAWDIISQSSSNDIKPFKMQVFTASGSQIEVKGKVSVTIEICGIQCIVDMIVADIDNDAIIGLDFLKDNSCKLDIENATFTVKDRRCKLGLAGKLGCYRVTESETVEIPARSEAIIEGKVSVLILRQSDLGMVEPANKQLGTGNSLIAKALICVKDTIPLRVVNFDNEKVNIYPGTHIANLSFVESIQPVIKKQEIPCSSEVPSHLQDLYERTAQGLTQEQCKEIAKLLTKYQASFSKSDSDLGRTGIIKHKIPTGDARPIKQPLRRLPEHMHEEVNTQIDDMLQKDVIQPSSSPWSSGIVMVQKKDGTKRFCIDYRKLNDVTKKDAYPLPRIDDSLAQLAGAKWFSCLDLNSGYWQVEVDEVDREKTAFMSRRGLFEFKVMPFGLCSAPASFERLMETVLAGLNWQICLIYLDDIIVIGKSFRDMVWNLEQVLDKLQGANLKLKPRKCTLFAKEVEFLVHVVSEAGIKTDPRKTEVVSSWPTPDNVHEVRSFLGFCSYYRRFIPQFAEVAKPLHCLTEKTHPFVWSEQCQEAFERLKKKMVEAPVLAHPDFSKPFIIDTDASDAAIGAVLSQNIDGQEHAIAYASRTLSKAEK